MKHLFSFFLILSLVFTLSAQKSQDILVLSYRYGLPTDYKETYTGEATETGMTNSLTAGFNIGPTTMFGINVNHFYFNVKGDPAIPVEMAPPVVLNGINVRKGLIQSFSEGRKLQLLIAPRLMSDFQNIDGTHWQMGGVVSYERAFHSDLSLGFGATYNKELFGHYLVPLFLIDWNLNSKWNIKGMLPITGRIKYRATENLELGFNHFGLSTTFALGDEAYAGDYIERFSVDLSLFARQRLFWNVYIEGMVGRTFGRNYKQYAGDQTVDFAIPLVTFGDNRVIKNVNFNDGIIIQGKLLINLPLE